jgi:hypothetical protein
MTLAQLEPQLAELSWTEKAELMRRLLGEVLNFWPGVEKTPGVVGGDACIVRTGYRSGLWKVTGARAGVMPRSWKTTRLCAPQTS